MPTYTFKRDDGEVVTKRLSFSDYEAVKAGDKTVQDSDGSNLTLVFNPGSVGFVLKDGISGGWASKTMKESKYRAARNRYMAQKEKDHVFKSRLIPNYKGQEAPTWRDAQEAARSEHGNAAASTYEPLVKKEKSSS